MMKKIMVSVVGLGLIGNLILPNFLASANSHQCTITIDANKHDWFNRAFPTSGCNESVITGYYDGSAFQLIGDNTKGVNNGEVVYLSMNNSVKVQTIPLKQTEPELKPTPIEPKPQIKPKPEPVQPKKVETPKPVEQKVQSKPESIVQKPKPAPVSKPTSSIEKSKQKNPKATEIEKKQDLAKSKNNLAAPTVKNEENIKNKNTAKNDVNNELKDLKFNDLKGKDVKVKKEGNNFIAVVEDIDGEKIEQNISKEEAEELGFEQKNNETEKAEKNKEKTTKVKSKDTQKNKEKLSKTNIITIVIGILILIPNGCYFYYKFKKTS